MGYDVPTAAKALRGLLANPDDLPKVFTVIEAMQGDAMQRIRDGVAKTAEGRALLDTEPDLVPLLADRDALRRLPEASLGRAYLDFVESENISAEGILAAAASGGLSGADDPLAWMRGRMRDTHDLWHAVTGYKGDLRGELALLCFVLGQNFETGVALIVSAGLVKGLGAGDRWLLVDAYVRGKRAEFLPGVAWERLLALPVSEVRARLNVGEPRRYEVVRTSMLREQGVLA